MSDNYIVHNEELEEIEAQLKELSKTYQDKYEESGKYLKNTPKLILWFFYCPIMLLLVLKTQFHLFSYDVFIIVFFICYLFCFLLITNKIKLPIVSKRKFLQDDEFYNIKFDLRSKYNLELQYISIDYDKIEFHLHQKAFARFKNIKKWLKRLLTNNLFCYII